MEISLLVEDPGDHPAVLSLKCSSPHSTREAGNSQSLPVAPSRNNAVRDMPEPTSGRRSTMLLADAVKRRDREAWSRRFRARASGDPAPLLLQVPIPEVPPDTGLVGHVLDALDVRGVGVNADRLEQRQAV